MSFKKLIGKLHLWLGLASGLVVFIVAITGCLYAFKEEIEYASQPYRNVAQQLGKFLPPSRIRLITDKQLPGKHLHAVLYQGKSKAAQAIYYSAEDNYYYKVFINPYTGELLKVKDLYSGFFHYVLEGHFYLWLPHKIGQLVVASATLIFMLLLTSGLFLWWKRKKGANGQRFKIKWDARWRRKNYDVHNVFGFYVTTVAFVFAITGLVWGFEWFSKGLYATISGGKEMIPYYDPASDTTSKTNIHEIPAIDKVWIKMLREYPEAEMIEVHIPETATSPIAANASPDATVYWKTDFRYFDQYTLRELTVAHIYGRLDQASTADKLIRMNYDIHIGTIFGLAGKVLAFFSSLIIASLPVTGFVIWWGRKKKQKKTKFNVRSSGSNLLAHNHQRK